MALEDNPSNPSDIGTFGNLDRTETEKFDSAENVKTEAETRRGRPKTQAKKEKNYMVKGGILKKQRFKSTKKVNTSN